MKSDNCWVVYIHTNNINNKKYIGITSKKPEYRWGRNGIGYRNNPHFWSAIQKYGWDNFKHEILLTNETFEFACKVERCLIRHYNTTNSKHGYNMTGGGEGAIGRIVSEETRKKISESNRGKKKSEELKKRLSELSTGAKNPIYGKHHTKETKEKVSKMHKERLANPQNHSMYGKHHSDETKKKIGEKAKERLSNPENHPNYGRHINVGINHANIRPIFCIEMGCIFWGAKEANKKYGFSIQGISDHLCGRRSYTGKHPETKIKLHWMYAKDAIEQGYITQEDLDNYLNNAKTIQNYNNITT